MHYTLLFSLRNAVLVGFLMASCQAAPSDELPLWSVCDVLRDRARFDGVRVRVRGRIEVQNEGAYLWGDCGGVLARSGKTWPWALSFGWIPVDQPGHRPEGQAKEPRLDFVATVTGVIASRESARYGHLGGTLAEIDASTIDDENVFEVPSLTVCDVVHRAGELAGNSVRVRGEYRFANSGAFLFGGQECASGGWVGAIWIEESFPPPPLSRPGNKLKDRTTVRSRERKVATYTVSGVLELAKQGTGGFGDDRIFGLRIVSPQRSNYALESLVVRP
jgi:hypothetical protein